MKYKAGDKVRVVADKQHPQNIGKTGVVETAGMPGTRDYPYHVKLDRINDDSAREYDDFKDEELELLTESDTVYLSGTPGQLEGFRQDWVTANLKQERPEEVIPKNGRGLFIDFRGEEPKLYVNTSQQLSGTPVAEHWQSLLERAAKHTSNVAPVKLGGYDVELDGSKLVIGCRKNITVEAFTTLADALVRVNKQGAKIASVNIYGCPKAVDVEDIQRVADWLDSKK